MKKLIGILAVVGMVVALVLVRMKRVKERDSAPLVKEVPVAVQTAPVRQGKVVHTRHVLGIVVGAEEIEVAPRVMGQVLEVRVREGAKVQEGDLLVHLDEREFEDAVAAAEAALASASVAYHVQHDASARDRRLFEVKAIAEEQWDRFRAAEAAAKAQLDIAEKRLDQAKTRLSYCRITAPADGLVARRLADPGDLGLPGKPLLKLVRQQTVRVRAELPAEDLAKLRVGQSVTLTLNDLQVAAKVSRVFPALSAAHLAAFEADLSDPPAGFVSGATVGVEVHLSAAAGLSVPTDALLEGDRGAHVFLVRDGRVHPVAVKVLDRSLDRVVVAGDLKPGENVMVARPARLMTLAEGMKVAETP